MLEDVEQLFRNYPGVTFCLMMTVFGWIGYKVVTQYLMEKQIRSFLPKIIFTVTFICSVSLLAMYLYQISLIDMSDALWDFVLLVQVIMCVFIIPTCLIFRIPFVTYRLPLCGKISLPVFPILLTIIYFRVVAYWCSQIKSKKEINEQLGILTKKHINILLQILVNYGVYLMAFMSAYGAVWCPYIYFNHIDTQRKDLKQAKKKAKDQIHFIIDQIKKNKYHILILKEKQKSLETIMEKIRTVQGKQSLFSKGLKALTSFSKNTEKEELNGVREKIHFHQKELQTLQTVHHQSFSVYRQIVDEVRKHNISETFLGRIFKLFSFFLTVYSISRFVLTAWNIVRGRKLSTDPITRLLNFITWIQGDNVNDSFRIYSQYISFGFMGYLMISSVRSFSINMKNFFDFILRRRRLNIMDTDTLVLLLSQMYGIYFLSAVILLQSSLPRTYVTNFEHITGQVSLVQHFTLFDKLFFWSCVASIVFIFFCEFQRKQKMQYIIKERNLINIKE